MARDRYTEEILRETRENPFVKKNMMVDVYHDIDHLKLRGIGIVDLVWWSDIYYQHKANIRLFSGEYIDGLLVEYVERRSMTGEELSQWFKNMNKKVE